LKILIINQVGVGILVRDYAGRVVAATCEKTDVMAGLPILRLLLFTEEGVKFSNFNSMLTSGAPCFSLWDLYLLMLIGSSTF
jgi:hypothetical protein